MAGILDSYYESINDLRVRNDYSGYGSHYKPLTVKEFNRLRAFVIVMEGR